MAAPKIIELKPMKIKKMQIGKMKIISPKLHVRNKSMPELESKPNPKALTLPKLHFTKPHQKLYDFFLTQKAHGSKWNFTPKTIMRKKKTLPEMDAIHEKDELSFTSTMKSKDFEYKLFYSSEEEENSLNELTGEKGIKNFYDVYKNKPSMRLNEVNKVYEHNVGTASLNYINKIEKMHILPQPIGLVTKGLKSQISIPNFSMGDKYAIALSAGLKSINYVESFDLRMNRLTNRGAMAILKNISNRTIRIDLSNNNLTLPTYKFIAKKLADYSYIIKELVLEKNQGGNQGCKVISEGLLDNYKLEYLNLSSNNISDLGAQYLSEMIEKNNKLKTLLLYWNNIKGTGGNNLAQAMSFNTGIQIFDGSFNSFGIYKVEENAQLWKNMFCENHTIIHIDLSHNTFNMEACTYISDGLRENHSIMGIHFMGNEGIVNSLGFINPSIHHNPSIAHIFCRIKPQLELGIVQNQLFRKFKATSNCWICEGWVEMRFDFISGITAFKILEEFDNVYLHLSFEKFSPDLMEESYDNRNRYLIRMVPPGPLKYFFSINGKQYIDKKAPQQLTPNTRDTDLIHNKIIPIHETNMAVTHNSTNVVHNSLKLPQIIDSTYISTMKCFPRPPPLNAKDAPPPLERSEEPEGWTLPKSIFWGYYPDSESLLNKCFEFDWKCSRMPNFIKDPNEVNHVKELLRAAYKPIREAYKYFSGVDSSNSETSIGQNTSTDMFIHYCKVKDDKYSLKDLDLDFIQTNAAGGKSQQGNPDRSLCRFELLEYIVRIALRKYIQGGVVNTPSEAVEKMLIDNFLPPFDNNLYDCHLWRMEHLWNEPCDIILKKHKKLIQALFKKYSGRQTMPGKPKFVSLEEFVEMITAAKVVDDVFGSRDIRIQFNLAMMTQVDEITQERHMQMFNHEFIEAISRVAFKLSISSPYAAKDTTISSMEEQKEQSFDEKIGAFLEKLLLSCMKKDFIRRYERKVLKTEHHSMDDSIVDEKRDSLLSGRASVAFPSATPRRSILLTPRSSNRGSMLMIQKGFGDFLNTAVVDTPQKSDRKSSFS